MARITRLVPFIGLGLVLSVSLTACGWYNHGGDASAPSSSPSSSASPSPSASPSTKPKTKEVKPYDPLTDTLPSECIFEASTVPWYDYSTTKVVAGDLNYRQYSTAIEKPYTATDATGSRTETISRIRSNMTGLSQWYNEVNTWPDTIVAKGWIQAFLTDVKNHGLDSFYELGSNGTPTVTKQGVKYAEEMCGFIYQFKPIGELTQPSVRYWQMGPYDPTHVPTVQLAPDVDNLDSWMYEWVNKAGKCVWQFGVNPHGGELAVYNCPTTSTPPSTPPTTPPTSTPKCETGHVWNGSECILQKVNHFPKPGTDGTTDDGTGTKPLAPAPTDPPKAPVTVKTDPPKPPDTGTTLPNQGDDNNGKVTD